MIKSRQRFVKRLPHRIQAFIGIILQRIHGQLVLLDLNSHFVHQLSIGRGRIQLELPGCRLQIVHLLLSKLSAFAQRVIPLDLLYGFLLLSRNSNFLYTFLYTARTCGLVHACDVS